MDFSSIKSDVFAGGFEHLNDAGAGLARVARFVNSAYKRDVVKHQLWPFRETTSTGAAPLTVATLGPIASVYDTSRNVKLHPQDRRTLQTAYPDLTVAGSARFYYVANGIVKTYPVGGTLSVVHWLVPADLTGTDTPIVPADYHELIVFGALRRAHMDAQNFDAASAYKIELAEGLQTMADELMQDQFDEPELILDTDTGVN